MFVARLTGGVQFTSAQTSFSIWVGSTTAYSFAFFLGANPVTTLSGNSLNPDLWTPVALATVFDRVTFTGSGSTALMTLDDFVTNAAVTSIPEPSSFILLAAGLASVAFGARRRRTNRQA